MTKQQSTTSELRHESVDFFQTGAYTLGDHIMSRAVRSLSRVISVKKIMRPFWNRWKSSLIGEETLTRFFDSIPSLDAWPQAALNFVNDYETRFAGSGRSGGIAGRVDQLRVLSFLCHLGQWGIMPLSPDKRQLYSRARDYYMEAERLAHSDRYHRVAVPWLRKTCWGNLHLPSGQPDQYPLIVVMHGMDDSKEEHLTSELGFQEHGFAVFCMDGPGQAESLFLEGIAWPPNFESCFSTALDELNRFGCDTERVGVIGVSWGGLWATKWAASDRRIAAVFDLGGPLDTSRFQRLPYFLKTRFCQALGVREPSEITSHIADFEIRDPKLLDRVRCAVRIVHGGKDPLVPVAEKRWLEQTLRALHPDQDVQLKIHPTGDHCCTDQAVETRREAAAFFHSVLD